MRIAAAEDRLSSVLHGELRRVVRGVMAHNQQACVLEIAAILNEVFLRVVHYRRGLIASPTDWQCRARFMSSAAPQLRATIRTFATSRKAFDRQVGLALGSAAPGEAEVVYDFMTLDRLLSGLADSDAGLAVTLELVCFGGLTDVEVSYVMETSVAKARRDRECGWSWLLKKIANHNAPHGSEMSRERA